MTGTIQNTVVLALSSVPGPTGRDTLGNLTAVYVEHSPGGSTLVGMILTSTDGLGAGGMNRTTQVTLWKQAAGAQPFTGVPIWSGNVAPGVPVQIGGAQLAQGDAIVGQASFGGIVGVELDGALSADPVTQSVVGLQRMTAEFSGASLPAAGETAAGADSR